MLVRDVFRTATRGRAVHTRSRERRARVLSVAVLAALGSVLFAACEPTVAPCSSTWVGPDGGSFTEPDNWEPVGVPGPTDRACSGSGSAIVLDDVAAVMRLTFEGSLEILADGALELNGSYVDGSYRTQAESLRIVTGGVLETNGVADVESIDLSGGEIGGAGQILVSGVGAPNNISDGATLTGRVMLAVLGQTTWTSGDLSICGSATFLAGGLFSAQVADGTIGSPAAPNQLLSRCSTCIRPERSRSKRRPRSRCPSTTSVW